VSRAWSDLLVAGPRSARQKESVMRKVSVVLAGLLTAGFVGATAGPALASDEAVYPVLCLHIVLPNGTPLPVVCIPDPR
jgi:hypothetical protein